MVIQIKYQAGSEIFVIPPLNLMVMKLYEESSKLFFLFFKLNTRGHYCRTVGLLGKETRKKRRSHNANRFIKASLE